MKNKHNYIGFGLLLVFVLGANGIFGQTKMQDFAYGSEEYNLAKQSIQVLNDGALVVKLATNTKQINYLKEVMEKRELSKNRMKNAEAQLNKIVKETEELNAYWMKTLLKHYDFSPIYFIYDTDFEAFKNKESGIFLNAQGERDPAIEMGYEKYLYLNFGKPLDDRLEGVEEGIYFTDANFKELNKPFPYFFKKNDILGMMYIDTIVKRMNRRLEKFCRKVCEL